MRIYQLTNLDIGNDRAMSTGDRTVFGLPCRFPAKPPIVAERRVQVYDRKRFFGAEGTPKNFFPGVFPRGRERERRGYSSAGSLPAFRTDIIAGRAILSGLPGPALTSIKPTDISFGPLADREIPDAL